MLVPGETVWLRHLQRHRIGLVVPFQAVADLGDAVLLWAPPDAAACAGRGGSLPVRRHVA
jgi:hypothetical protein